MKSNTMKRYLLLIAILFIACFVNAQISVRDGSFKEVGQFYTMLEDMTDDNYTPFAVIRIQTENMTAEQVEKLGFQGDARTFFNIEFHDTEVWVYLTYLATYLKITHPDLSSTEFTIPYDMEPLHGYEIVLVNGAVTSNIGSGTLLVTTDPPGATIEIDGVVMDTKTPYSNDLIASGEHTVTVSIKHYLPSTKTILITNGSNEVLNITLERDFGQLAVSDGDYPGATVYVDGVVVGVTPLQNIDLPTGPHRLQVKKEGMEEWDLSINIFAHEETYVNCPMIPIIKTKTFTIKDYTFEMVEVECEGGNYYIGRYEVTDKLWRVVMGKKANEDWYCGECPVSWVSWKDIQKFIKKLNKLTKAEFRLPTVAEWEYAAKGGKWSLKYDCDDIDKTKEWITRSNRQKRDVGKKGHNELRMYDTAGNVGELCSDTGPSNEQHVAVDGSYDKFYSRYCLRIARRYMKENEKYEDVGFRLVLDQ